MVIATRIEQLNDCLIELEKIRINKKTDSSRALDLGRKALLILNDLISEKPNDFSLRSIRVKLNSDWLFNNYNQIYDDAQYIVNNPDYASHKMFGYKWLLKANDRLNGGIKEVISILENKLIDVHLIYKSAHKKNKILSDTYYDLAKAYLKAGNENYAYQLLELSFDYNPYVNNRNLYLGLHMLKTAQYQKAEKYLWAHFLWGNHTSRNKIMRYGIFLNTLYENNHINEYPNLKALLFHIIRNNKSSFGCYVVTDFFKKFGDKLLDEVQKHPENSKLHAVLANTYYLDFNDYEKALAHYQKMLFGNDPFYNSYVTRIYACCETSTSNLLKQVITNNSNFNAKDLFGYYQIANDLFNLYFDTQNSKFLKLSEHYVKHSYDVMNAYLKYNVGDTYCNSILYFDSICSLYGKILTTYADSSNDIEQKQTLLVCAASVYWDGFNYSYSAENLELALATVLQANNAELFICYIRQLIAIDEKFAITIEIFKLIYRVNYKLLEKEDLKRMHTLYIHTKQLIEKHKIDDLDSMEVFINLAFDYYSLSINLNQNLDFVFGEINCLIGRDNLSKVHKDIYGVLLYYIGFCYDINQDCANAKKWYSQAILILKDINDSDFLDYYNKALAAYNAIKIS
jgi:hypothetical protein